MSSEVLKKDEGGLNPESPHRGAPPMPPSFSGSGPIPGTKPVKLSPPPALLRPKLPPVSTAPAAVPPTPERPPESVSAAPLVAGQENTGKSAIPKTDNAPESISFPAVVTWQATPIPVEFITPESAPELTAKALVATPNSGPEKSAETKIAAETNKPNSGAEVAHDAVSVSADSAPESVRETAPETLLSAPRNPMESAVDASAPESSVSADSGFVITPPTPELPVELPVAATPELPAATLISARDIPPERPLESRVAALVLPPETPKIAAINSAPELPMTSPELPRSAASAPAGIPVQIPWTLNPVPTVFRHETPPVSGPRNPPSGIAGVAPSGAPVSVPIPAFRKRLWVAGILAVAVLITAFFFLRRPVVIPLEGVAEFLSESAAHGAIRYGLPAQHTVVSKRAHGWEITAAFPGRVVSPLYDMAPPDDFLKRSGYDPDKHAQAEALLAGPDAEKLRAAAGMSPGSKLLEMEIATARIATPLGTAVTFQSTVEADNSGGIWTYRMTEGTFISGDVRGGYRKVNVRPDIPILVVDNPGDLERVKLMASYRNSQADKIIAAAGKSGIPVAQRADSAPVQATIPAAQPAGAPVEFLKPGTLFSGTASRIFEGVQTFVIVEIVQYSPVTHSLSLVMRNNGGWTDARPYRGTAFPVPGKTSIVVDVSTRADQAIPDSGPWLQEPIPWRMKVDFDGRKWEGSVPDSGVAFALTRLDDADASAVKAELTQDSNSAKSATAPDTYYTGIAMSKARSTSTPVIVHFLSTAGAADDAVSAEILAPGHPEWRRTASGKISANMYRTNSRPIRLTLDAPSPIPGAPADGFFGNSGEADIGWGSEGTHLTGEDSAFRYDLERSDKATVSKLLIPAIPVIADATGKSGIPTGQRANSVPESNRFLSKAASDSGRGIVPESGNSGSRNRGPGTVDSGNSASGIPVSGVSLSATTGLPDLAIPPAQNASASPAESVGFRSIPASNSGNGIAAESGNSNSRNRGAVAGDSADSVFGIPPTQNAPSATLNVPPSTLNPGAPPPATAAESHAPESLFSEARLPTQAGAYTWADNQWKPLPRNGSRITYGASAVLNGALGILNGLSGKSRQSSTGFKDDHLADLTFSGTEPVPTADARKVVILYIGSIQPLPDDLLRAHPEIRDFPSMEMAAIATATDGKRTTALLRIVPGLAGFREKRIPGQLLELKPGHTVLASTAPVMSGHYALAVNHEFYEFEAK